MMTAGRSAEVSKIKVLIVHPRDHDGEILIRHFQRLGNPVTNSWPPSETVDVLPDLLMCLCSAAARPLIETALGHPGLPVVGIVDAGDPEALRILNDATPHALVLRPIVPGAIGAAVRLAASLARQHKQQLTRIMKLEETLRSFRKVEQAKTILMARRKMQEPVAYGFLRDEAMRRRVSVGAVAASIIRSHEMLPELEE